MVKKRALSWYLLWEQVAPQSTVNVSLLYTVSKRHWIATAIKVEVALIVLHHIHDFCIRVLYIYICMCTYAYIHVVKGKRRAIVKNFVVRVQDPARRVNNLVWEEILFPTRFRGGIEISLSERKLSLSLSQSVSHQGYKCRSRPEEDSTWKTVSKNVDASLIYSGTLDAIRTKGKIFRSKRVRSAWKKGVGYGLAN